MTSFSDAVNLVLVSGHIGKVGTLGTTQGGQQVVNVTVRSTETRQERGGTEPRPTQEWHRIVAYGELAALAATLVPNSYVLIQGRFKSNHRIQKGVHQHSVDIIADKINVIFAPK